MVCMQPEFVLTSVPARGGPTASALTTAKHAGRASHKQQDLVYGVAGRKAPEMVGFECRREHWRRRWLHWVVRAWRAWSWAVVGTSSTDTARCSPPEAQGRAERSGPRHPCAVSQGWGALVGVEPMAGAHRAARMNRWVSEESCRVDGRGFGIRRFTLHGLGLAYALGLAMAGAGVGDAGPWASFWPAQQDWDMAPKHIKYRC